MSHFNSFRDSIHSDDEVDRIRHYPEKQLEIDAQWMAVCLVVFPHLLRDIPEGWRLMLQFNEYWVVQMRGKLHKTKRNVSLGLVCIPWKGARKVGKGFACSGWTTPPMCRKISWIHSHDSKNVTVLISSELHRRHSYP